MSPPDMTIGMALLFSQRSLDQRSNSMASTGLCPARPRWLQAVPAASSCQIQQCSDQKCHSRAAPSLDLVSAPPGRSPSPCSTTTVRLLTGFHQGPRCLCQLLSAPRGGRRQPGALAPKCLTLKAWDPLSLFQPLLVWHF